MPERNETSELIESSAFVAATRHTWSRTNKCIIMSAATGLAKSGLLITRQESYRKCYITSFNLLLQKRTSEQFHGKEGFYTASLRFSFFGQHRFGSVLNRCETAKKVTQIDFSNFKGLRLYILSKMKP